MTVIVESLKRLYDKKQIDVKKIKDLFGQNKITQEEYLYILGKEK